MSAANGSAQTDAVESKGKGRGKATEDPVDQPMEEDDDDTSDEDEGNAAAAEDDDNMDEIDTSNIVQDGRRTRGKVINWAQAAKDIPGDDEDDEEEDEDFEAGDDEDDNMED